MRWCILPLLLIFIYQNLKLVSSNKGFSNEGSSTGDHIERGRSKGEHSNRGITKKGQEKEKPGPSKNQIRCNRCGTCDPNPCVCYGKVSNSP